MENCPFKYDSVFDRENNEFKCIAPTNLSHKLDNVKPVCDVNEYHDI